MESHKPVSFGIAMEAIKLGHFFRRLDWPEHYIAVYLMKGTAPEALLEQAKEEGHLEHIDPSLFESKEAADKVRFPLMVLVTDSGSEPGWAPSQRDMAACDWVVVS